MATDTDLSALLADDMPRGFGPLPCPRCGEECATITLDLRNLECHCAECDNDFDLAEVRNFIRRWLPVLEWARAAPTRAAKE